MTKWFSLIETFFWFEFFLCAIKYRFTVLQNHQLIVIVEEKNSSKNWRSIFQFFPFTQLLIGRDIYSVAVKNELITWKIARQHQLIHKCFRNNSEYRKTQTEFNEMNFWFIIDFHTLQFLFVIMHENVALPSLFKSLYSLV